MEIRNSGLLRRYFSGVTEDTFAVQLGVADPPLIDYISDMLVRFVRCEAVFRVRDLAGRRLHEVGEMLVEASERVGDARREVHRHVGDFTLFWTGVYPETLKKLRGESRIDHLIDYQAEGKKAYLIASTIESSSEDSTADNNAVLERLSQQFELCAYGLQQVRKQWESKDGESPDRPIIL